MKHFQNISFEDGRCVVNISTKSLNKNIKDAQFWLDSQVMTDMIPYMPSNTGTFINLTRARSAAIAGSGTVVAAAPPMGRFLYMGKVMVDELTESPFARPGAKKILAQPERSLTYSNPSATPRWFETAKEKHGKQWVEGVKKRIGGK